VSATLRIDPTTALVYPEGWQSWTPTTTYHVTDQPHRPVDANHRRIGYRADSPTQPGPASEGHPTRQPGFVGEGLLAVQPAAGEQVRIFATESPFEVPSIRANIEGDSVRIEADGPFTEHLADTANLTQALRDWAQHFAAAEPPRPAPRVWCSWYQYFMHVTESDIGENLDAMAAHNLPVDVVQIDDGYQRHLGDWLDPSDRFDDLAALVARIREAGRRAGIWVAPFLAGERSSLAAEHPNWLIPDADPGWNWDQQLRALDTRQPAARQHLHNVFAALAALGIDYFKLDFLYAGALQGSSRTVAESITAYRSGLELIRDAVGPESHLVGCGAPMLASVGLVDAMRVSPDTAAYVEPASGDLSSPSQRSAMLTGRARQWQNGILWTNDPDCLIARGDVAQREQWAAYVNSVDGLRSISDRINSLDDWGLRTTRAYLTTP
jgi:alpha-galactosidase